MTIASRLPLVLLCVSIAWISSASATTSPLDDAWMTIQLQTTLAKGKAFINDTDPATAALTTTAIKVDSGKGKCFMNLAQITATQYTTRTLCLDGAGNWHLTSTNNVYDQHDGATLANDWPSILFIANGKSKGTDDVGFHYEGEFALSYKIKDGHLQSVKALTKGSEGMAAFNDHSNAASHIDATGKAKLSITFIKDPSDPTVLPADAQTCLAVAKGDISSPSATFDNCAP